MNSLACTFQAWKYPWEVFENRGVSKASIFLHSQNSPQSRMLSLHIFICPAHEEAPPGEGRKWEIKFGNKIRLKPGNVFQKTQYHQPSQHCSFSLCFWAMFSDCWNGLQRKPSDLMACYQFLIPFLSFSILC